MPVHEMPFADNDDCDRFFALSPFVQGYIHAIFFTECHGDNPELESATFADMDATTLKTAVEDCEAFQEAHADLLEQVYSDRYDAECAGTDFWFTRNGHGAGYWDRGLGKPGDALADAARAYGSADLYRGDDGRLYLS